MLDAGGFSGDLSGATFPIKFPGDGATIPLTHLDASEQPGVLETCPASYSTSKDSTGFPVAGPPQS